MAKIKTVICKSGAEGYQMRLHDSYDSFEDFESYSNMYGLHEKLGYKTAKNAWNKNPLIEGSTNPSDYRRSTESNRKRR
jgi:hypothetical protein